MLELCNSIECFNREQYYINTLNPQYNILKFTGCGSLGYKHTDESKKKISIASAGRNHPAYSGEYIFYHPAIGYIINDRINFSESQFLKKIRVHKLCSGIFNQYKGWICLENYKKNFIYPTNIDEIYYQKVHANTPIRIFYHKKFGIFTGQIKDILKQFNLSRRGFVGLCNGARQSNYGWIHLGTYTKNFKLPDNINKTYNERLSLNSKIKNLSNQIISVVHTDGNNFCGTIREFSKKYNLHLRCVIRLYNCGRKKYRGWTLKNVD
jgi:small nuclear ribonucleoprotein (snRNP)-like protein